MRALIIGPNGQDGKLIRDRINVIRNQVYGLTRNTLLNFSRDRIIEIEKRARSDSSDLNSILEHLKPDLIFHMAAIHGSSNSMQSEIHRNKNEMLELHVGYTKSILEWQLNHPSSKSFFALSSQMYSYSASEQSINEDTEFSPQNFYGETKVIALELIREYRSTSKVNASGLILFNHASEYNNKKFLFPIIAQQLSLILQGATNQLSLRNPLASIEMTSAREIVDAIMLISELGESGDFVLAQGVSYKIERIIQEVCKILNLPGIDIESINPPIIEPCLVGDITKAKKVLNWAPSQKPWEVLKDMTIKTSNINP